MSIAKSLQNSLTRTEKEGLRLLRDLFTKKKANHMKVYLNVFTIGRVLKSCGWSWNWSEVVIDVPSGVDLSFRFIMVKVGLPKHCEMLLISIFNFQWGWCRKLIIGNIGIGNINRTKRRRSDAMKPNAKGCAGFMQVLRTFCPSPAQGLGGSCAGWHLECF